METPKQVANELILLWLGELILLWLGEPQIHKQQNVAQKGETIEQFPTRVTQNMCCLPQNLLKT